VLVGDGTLFLDGRAHETIYDGAMTAAGHGANVVRFRHEDPADLEQILRTTMPPTPRVIAIDGVNSMTGNAPNLAAFSRIAQDYDCLLYVDDAHGFGVIGERSTDEPSPYGRRGNGIFKHQGVPYENAVLVAGLSKSYSSLLAFIALPTKLKNALKVLAPPYLYSGPSPVASLATTLAGLEVNRTRGDAVRADLHAKTNHLLGELRRLGIRTPNRSGYPIIEVPLANHEEIDQMGRYLFERGQYATMAAYPLVPKNEVGFRVQVTAANTFEQIDDLVDVLESMQAHFQLESSLAPAAV
jgi:8-amino-7-oxononanoate synthase